MLFLGKKTRLAVQVWKWSIHYFQYLPAIRLVGNRIYRPPAVLQYRGGQFCSRQQTADSRQHTEDSRQHTADSRQQPADSRQPTADSRQKAKDSRQQTSEKKQQEADSERKAVLYTLKVFRKKIQKRSLFRCCLINPGLVGGGCQGLWPTTGVGIKIELDPLLLRRCVLNVLFILENKTINTFQESCLLINHEQHKKMLTQSQVIFQFQQSESRKRAAQFSHMQFLYRTALSWPALFSIYHPPNSPKYQPRSN